MNKNVSEIDGSYGRALFQIPITSERYPVGAIDIAFDDTPDSNTHFDVAWRNVYASVLKRRPDIAVNK
ncbi:MAG: hypothetical protein LAT57_02350 [Balneolales bacterium]|nr:hypothetical protein [Balneolales bacterium]